MYTRKEALEHFRGLAYEANVPAYKQRDVLNDIRAAFAAAGSQKRNVYVITNVTGEPVRYEVMGVKRGTSAGRSRSNIGPRARVVFPSREPEV